MGNNKKGVSVIVGSVLLIFIAIAGSILVYNAFSTNISTPNSNIPAILEKLSITQITNSSGKITAYVQNTGSVSETVDSIYLIDVNGNLLGKVRIDPVVLSPGQSAWIPINTTGIDITYLAYVQAFTQRGDSAKLEITPAAQIFFTSYSLPHAGLNDTNSSYPGFNNLLTLDNVTFNSTSNPGATVTGGPIHPNRGWDALTNNSVGQGGADIHLQHDGVVECVADIPNSTELLNLNGSIYIFEPGGKSATWTIAFYNWITQSWGTSPPGNLTGTTSGGPFYITFFLDQNDVFQYVSTNGTFAFKIAVDIGGTGTSKFTFNDVNLIPTYRGTYDGVLIFNMTQAFLSIQTITFNYRLYSNTTGTLGLYVFNFQSNAWEIFDFFPVIGSTSSINWLTRTTIVSQNCINYVDATSHEVKVMVGPYPALSTGITVNYDYMQMVISGTTTG